MKIKIYRDAIDPADLEALIALIETAGHEADLVDGLPGADCDPEETSVVILYPEGSDFDGAIAKVARTRAVGCKVFGVWPRGAQDQPTPSIIGHHGKGTADWSSDSLARVISSPAPLWLRPTGRERPQPKSVHHQCNQRG